MYVNFYIFEINFFGLLYNKYDIIYLSVQKSDHSETLVKINKK